jgi:hypothetical protein
MEDARRFAANVGDLSSEKPLLDEPYKGFHASRVADLKYLAKRAAALHNGSDVDALIRDLCRKIVTTVPAERMPSPRQPATPESAKPAASAGRIETDDVDFGDDSKFDDEGNLLPEYAHLITRSGEQIEPPAAAADDGYPRSRMPAGPEQRPIPPGPHGPLAKKLNNGRRYELKRLWFTAYRKNFRKFDDFLANLRGRLGNRDPGDRQEVGNQELGRVLDLTSEKMIAIEGVAIEYGRGKGWETRAGKPYTFAFRTIAPCNVTAAEWKKLRRQQNNAKLAASRKAKRAANRENTMMETQTTATTYAIHAEYIAAQKARTAEQIDLLVEVAKEWKTPAALMEAVREDPAWHGFPNERKFYQTVITRLDMARDQGRIIERRERGPRGSKLRLVRRAEVTS